MLIFLSDLYCLLGDSGVLLELSPSGKSMKKITILNGTPGDRAYELDSFLEEVETLLQFRGHQIAAFELRRMDIRHCTGCWGCWVKTPGECVIADDSAAICRSVVGSELVLFASPVIMGFTSALLKRACDRLIPIIHPYFEIVDGEFHHRSRYDRYPEVGLILEKSADTDQKDIDIIGDIYSRMAVNLKSELRMIRFTEDSPREVADAIDSI